VVLAVWAACGGRATRGEILLADALESLALGDSAKALERLEEARYLRPHDDRILFHLGRLHTSRGTVADRAYAETALRAAVDRKPDIGVYREALGLLLQEQGFHNDSIDELQRAVRLDPGLARAWRGLGLELLHDWREDPTALALRDSIRQCFERALAADPHDDDARAALACMWLFGYGDIDAARAVAAPPAGRGGCSPRFDLLQSAIELRARQIATAAEALDRALDCLPPDERADWTAVRVLMSPDSANAWGLYTQSERDSISQDFWHGADPTPTTLVNERLLEHVSRRIESDFLFAPQRRRKPGHLTDRGEVFIRWGMPRVAQRDVARQARVWRWFYGPGEADFVFYDTYLNGDYVRQRLGAGSDYMYPETFDAVPERTTFTLGDPARRFRWLAARFRGAGDRVAVQFVCEVESESVGVGLRVAAWNGPRRRIAFAGVPPARAALAVRGPRLVSRAWLDVVPPAAQVALEVETAAHGRGPTFFAAGTRDLDMLSARPDSLEMSDLLPAYELGGGESADARLAVRVPRADSTITDGRLHVYFEIYPARATVAAHRTLAVAYRVQALPPAWRFRDQFSAAARARRDRRTAVQATFDMRVRREREPQRLSVDVQPLSPGPYLFAVTVHDEVTGESCERSWAFAIPEADRSGGGE
jgi:GWxTD domain-containing protein